MEEWDYKQWKENISNNEVTALYVYTPMCGTCQVARKMMQVVEHILPNISYGMININFNEQLAIDYRIESVPCLLISKQGEVVDKIYAFKSVQNLLEKLNLPIDESYRT